MAEGLEVVGSEKTIWNTQAGYFIGDSKSQEPIQPLDGVPTRMDRLVAIIRGELDPAILRADLEATYDTVAIMAAAYASTKKGAWVSIV